MPAGVASFIQKDCHIGANWNSPPAHSIPLRSMDLSIRYNDRQAIGSGTRKRRKIFSLATKSRVSLPTWKNCVRWSGRWQISLLQAVARLIKKWAEDYGNFRQRSLSTINAAGNFCN